MPDEEPLSQEGPREANSLDLEAERERLLNSVASQSFDTLERKVAWTLNNFPETRDSDVALALKFWETFDSEYFNGRNLDPNNLFKLTRINSLTRCRAKVQNKYNLFLASPVVRKRRGKLAEEEKAKAIEDTASFPSLAVFADESGKTQDYVVVGSLWILNGLESLRLAVQIRNYMAEKRFTGEFHFKEVNSHSEVEVYKGLIELVLENSSALSFKMISARRAGAGHIQQILDRLYFFLLKRGVEHEAGTARTPLPRRLQLWKDKENEGPDKILLADLKEELKTASATQMDGKLYLDDFSAVDSKGAYLLQVADLFTASLGRVYNNPTTNPQSPKDVLAHYFLNRLGIPLDHDSEESFSDMAVKLKL